MSTQYNSIAESYASYDELPVARLEQELVAKALGDCTGLSVLDLGGGNGQYARKAIDLGAELADVLDISSSMLEVGIKIEADAGRQGKIRWFEADATKALHHLPLMPDGYDVVMCNWLFDHATTDEVSTKETLSNLSSTPHMLMALQDLETMWRNASTQLKPGGKLVNARVIGHIETNQALLSGKYGVSYSDLTRIPSGVQYQVHCHTQPPFQFGGHFLDKHADLSNDINHCNGLGDLELMEPRDTEAVKNDREFWTDFLEEPFMGVAVARKP
jgi:SAM-dependent methyltransferase